MNTTALRVVAGNLANSAAWADDAAEENFVHVTFEFLRQELDMAPDQVVAWWRSRWRTLGDREAFLVEGARRAREALNRG